jgi:hopene-associated glycosyltransferase HpnB
MLILSILAAAVWAYLIFARGSFWRVELPVRQAAASGRVVAVVPARNEAETVGRAVTSLLQQQRVDLRVVLVDDASADTTSAIALAAAESIGMADRLTILRGTPLAAGWTGKLWAVQQGVAQALASAPDFILLTDADIEHDPQSAASLAAIAEGGFDLASYMVKLRCTSAAERLLIPAFVYFFFQLYPPRWIADSKSKTGGAAGGCMLLRPAALERAGGIAAIRGEIIDDCALARAVKGSGGRVWLGPTESSRSLRSYGTMAEIGRMVSRTAFNQLRHSAWLLLLTMAGLLLTYVAPLVCVASGHWIAGMLGGAAWAAMTLSYLPMVRFYGLQPLWALTLPLAALFYLGATVWSAVRYWSGRGGEWKGRAQDRNT